MTFVVISPAPVQQFLDANGKPLSGGLLFTYAGGTTAKTPTYTDATGTTPNTNPIVLNLFGETPQAIFIPPATNIKFTLSPAGDTDPPSNPIWTVDNVSAPTTQFGDMAGQNSGNIAISGGTITVGTLTCTGATTLSTLEVSGVADLDANLDVSGSSTFAGVATFNANVNINGVLDVDAATVSIGNTAGSSSLEIQALSTGFAADIRLQTGASTRWAIYKDITAESGANIGSDFTIDTFADSGNVNFTALKITRATGLVTIRSLLIDTNGGLTLSSQVDGHGASLGTLSNAPVPGNPFWVPATVNGLSGWFPFFHT